MCLPLSKFLKLAGGLYVPLQQLVSSLFDVGRRRKKTNWTKESVIKSGNWAEGEGRGGVVGSGVASSPLYQRVHGGGRTRMGYRDIRVMIGHTTNPWDPWG